MISLTIRIKYFFYSFHMSIFYYNGRKSNTSVYVLQLFAFVLTFVILVRVFLQLLDCIFFAFRILFKPLEHFEKFKNVLLALLNKYFITS